MNFGWIVLLILGMFYIGMVIPNQQRLKALEMVLTTINKSIDAGLITKEEFDKSMKEIAKELDVKSGTTGTKE